MTISTNVWVCEEEEVDNNKTFFLVNAMDCILLIMLLFISFLFNFFFFYETITITTITRIRKIINQNFVIIGKSKNYYFRMTSIFYRMLHIVSSRDDKSHLHAK